MRSHPGRPLDRNATLLILSCYFGGLLNGPFGQEMLHATKYARKMAPNKACRHAGTTHAKPRQSPIKRQFWRGFVMDDQMVSQQDIQPFKTLFNRIVIPFQTTILAGAPIWSFLYLDGHLDRHLDGHRKLYIKIEKYHLGGHLGGHFMRLTESIQIPIISLTVLNRV